MNREATFEDFRGERLKEIDERFGAGERFSA